ncbi:hypothetical protein [Bradyrhizobium yuanmingense]|uniref:Uncharacterized protein n=1 Tax=Bradyrhizobium yuanmingense TaxID=108015 RepID=A0ABV4G731_9BRAD|nr:hypothetical protein [Bradyrhizobium yuanmingense]
MTQDPFATVAAINVAEDEARLREALKYLVECKEAAEMTEGP